MKTHSIRVFLPLPSIFVANHPFLPVLGYSCHEKRCTSGIPHKFSINYRKQERMSNARQVVKPGSTSSTQLGIASKSEQDQVEPKSFSCELPSDAPGDSYLVTDGPSRKQKRQQQTSASESEPGPDQAVLQRTCYFSTKGSKSKRMALNADLFISLFCQKTDERHQYRVGQNLFRRSSGGALPLHKHIEYDRKAHHM